MSLCDITLQSNVIDASFSKSGSRIAVLTDEGFSVYHWSPKRKPVAAPKLESTHPFSTPADCRPRHISFLNENEVYVLKHYDASQPVIEMTLLQDQKTAVIYQPTRPEHVLSIFSSIDQDKLWLSRRRKGKSVAYVTITSNSDGRSADKIWDQSPSPETVWADSVKSTDDEVGLLFGSATLCNSNTFQEILFSMSRSGSLFANKRLLAKNCTSFLVTPIHLIFTTTQHLLKFVHISTVESETVLTLPSYWPTLTLRQILRFRGIHPR